MSGRSAEPRYVVGIDLGTTHTVVASADTHASAPAVELFRIPQLIAAGEVAARENLPSFRYHPLPDELSDDDLALGFAQPLPELPRGVVGTLAQRLGGRSPGRLVASAKSWLCHSGVERHAAILPWGAPQDVPKISPIDASASYLAHVRAAWDAAHPDAPLSAQEIVLTVPASFDEVARALTLEAAQRAGLPRLRLLEEPQAAFYAWLDRHRDDVSGALGDVRLALVLDVGGGTTDLTLIRVEVGDSGPRLTRLAVGDHLMLGGDNMDRALSHLCEPALAGGPGSHLSAGRLSQLLEQCRLAKEQLLGTAPPEAAKVALLGGGSKLIAAQVSTSLPREQATQTVVDGFFPAAALEARPAVRRSALTEFGLPYAADPAITRHVAAFLGRHRTISAEAFGLAPELAEREPRRALPDAVLFNGGVFHSPAIEARMLQVLQQWRGAPLTKLDNLEPDLAVARGAVAYGLARRGVGLRIGGGSPRSYYLRVEAAGGEDRAVCVLPRGAQEGEEFSLKERAFMLRVGRPVQFRLLTSTSEATALPGALVAPSDDYQVLPDLAAVIDTGQRNEQELQVELHAQLTEVGTLELSLVALDAASRRYHLEFQLRGAQAQAAAPARVTQLHPRFAAASQLIAAFYGKASKDVEGKKIRNLRSDLEKLLGPRESWDLALLRELCGQLLAGARRRRRSPEHERLWYNLAGYTLRPGFGYPADGWRVEQVAALYGDGVQAATDAHVWSQFWILWRRIAGGLDEAQQTRIVDDISYYLEPQGARPRPRPKGPRAQGLDDMVRLAGALERLPPERKLEIGNWLLSRLARKELSQAAVYWSLGRLGARMPWHGSAHTVIAPELVAAWLQALLSQDLAKIEQGPFAVAQLARYTADRARDVDPQLRERAAAALARVPGSEPWIKLVREGGELGEHEAGRVFGESLPVGLRLL